MLNSSYICKFPDIGI